MKLFLFLFAVLLHSVSSKLVEIESEEEFKEKVLEASKPVFVMFSAPWCGPCRQFKPVVEEESKSNKDVLFFTMNIDNVEAVTNKYGLMAVPTSFLFKNGKVVEKMKGNSQKAELKDFLKKNA